MNTHIDDQGRVWKPYSFTYVADGIKFAITFFALSPIHAQCVLEDIKATAKINEAFNESEGAVWQPLG